MEVTWGPSGYGGEQKAEQVKWVAPGGWDDDIANRVDRFINDMSFFATEIDNEVDGVDQSNQLHNYAREITTAANTVKYLHARAEGRTAEGLKMDLEGELTKLGGKSYLAFKNASVYSKDYNDLKYRGSKDNQARINGMIGVLYLNESEA